MTTTNLFTNRATAKLALALASGDSAITLVPGGGDWFPSPGANQYFRLVVQKGSGQTDQREYMTCTSRTGDVLTVTRGQEGTPAANFAAADECSLVVTATSFGEFPQKQGMVLQGALEVEAPPATPLGIANKQYVDDSGVDDVPNDGVTYGRQFGLWDALGDAAQLPVPIPVGAGGTGGISLSEAQLNLVIARTSIDDLAPANPRYGDRWIKPSNMTELVWVPNQGGTGGEGVWINPMDSQSEAYPIPISKGGTGATTAAQARINLGIEYTTQPFKLFDGTVAAPGLAWASEPGLGWYRTSAGTFRIAAQGANVISYGMSDPAITFVGHNPRAVGRSQINLDGQPVGSADYNSLFLQGVASGPAIIGTAAGGASTRQSLVLDAPQVRVQDGTAAVPGLAWANEPTSGWTRPSSGGLYYAVQGAALFVLGGSNPALGYMQLSPRTSGQAQFNMQTALSGATQTLSFAANASNYSISEALSGGATSKQMVMTFAAGIANVVDNGFFITPGSGQPSALLYLDAKNNTGQPQILGRVGGVSRWQINFGGTGGPSPLQILRFNDAGAFVNVPLDINRQSGGVTMPFNLQCNVLCGGSSASEASVWAAASAASTPTWPDIQGGMVAVRAVNGPSYGAGAVTIYSGVGGTGVALYAGTQAWAAASDERLKKDIGEVAGGLEAVLAIRPIRFHYKTDAPNSPLRIGVSAQSVQTHIPEAVSEAAELEFDPDAESGTGTRPTGATYLAVRYTELIPHLISAIKTLNQRIHQLEKHK